MLTSGVFGYLADYCLWWVLVLSLLVHTWCFFRFFPRKTYRKTGLVIGNGLVFACMVGLAALGGESYFRFVSVETDAFGMSLPARRWFVLHTRLNSLGCRDVEWAVEKPPGVWRIAFVGDSFTYGWGIKRVEDRFPDLVQAMFDRRRAVHGANTSRDRKGAVPPSLSGRGRGRVRPPPYPPLEGGEVYAVQVMNVAKPGWDTGAQLKPIRDMITVYAVDEIVLCYVPNDIEKLLPRTAGFDPIRPPEPRLFNPSSSCLVDYLYHRLWVPRAATVRGYHDWLADGFADPDIRRRHQQQLYDIIRYCHDHDVTLRVVLLPFIRTNGQTFQPQLVHTTLRRFFEANNVPVLDLLPTIAGKDAADLVVNGHDPHPNERANKLFAEAIWQAFYGTNER